MRRHLSSSLGLSLVDLGCERAAVAVLHEVTSLLSSRQHCLARNLFFFGQVLAFVCELYDMACHDSHLSNCRLMPDLELESAIAAGIAMNRSAFMSNDC